MGGHSIEQLTCGILPHREYEAANRSRGPITKNQAAALLKDFESVLSSFIRPVTPPAPAVRGEIELREGGLSERRATRLLEVDRSAARYRKKRKDDAADRELLRALAAERRRFGYRRLREMAKRKGRHMNLKKVYRLYREEGLAVRRRRGRKRAIGARAPLRQAQRPNQIWVLDFMSDVLESGRRFRVFNVEDQLTREGLAAEVDTSLPGPRVSAQSLRDAEPKNKPRKCHEGGKGKAQASAETAYEVRK